MCAPWLAAAVPCRNEAEFEVVCGCLREHVGTNKVCGQCLETARSRPMLICGQDWTPVQIISVRRLDPELVG